MFMMHSHKLVLSGNICLDSLLDFVHHDQVDSEDKICKASVEDKDIQFML